MYSIYVNIHLKCMYKLMLHYRKIDTYMHEYMVFKHLDKDLKYKPFIFNCQISHILPSL